MAILQVRELPEHVYTTLKACAARDRRSLAQEAVIMLERGLVADDFRQRRQRAIQRLHDEPLAVQDYALPDPVSVLRRGRDR
jgi:plasmid stability protein